MRKEIPNFEKYTIDEHGVVIGKRNKKPLKVRISRGGYPAVNLCIVTGKSTTRYIHRLLAETFIPNPDNKPQVNHIDGNKLNHSLNNLEWVTCSDNIQHAYDEGLHIKAKSVQSPNTVLCESDIHSICKKLLDGWRIKDIAKSHGVSYSVVKNIKRKTCFKDIVCDYDFDKLKRYNRISVETVLWVAKKLEEGFMPKEIVDISYNQNLNLQKVKDILKRRSFKELTNKFNF